MTHSPIARTLLTAPSWLINLFATIAGALIPLSFAPFHVWACGLLSLVVLALFINHQPLKIVLWRTWCFAVGMYAVGISWIYVSISGFGGAPIPLAILLVAVFVFFMAAVFALPFYLFGRWFSQHPLSLIVAFPTIWLLSEWLRTWLFTGFPWLFVGYGHLHTWLSGWAPVLGVMGLSLILAFTAGVVAHFLFYVESLSWSSLKKIPALLITSTITLCLWIGGFVLQSKEWTAESSAPIKVAIVQPNIAQEIKWQMEFRDSTLELLREETDKVWDHKIIIWPESAVPFVYSQALPFLNEMNTKASDHHAGLITGIIFDDPTKDAYYNSVATFGSAIGIYHKRRLVPFGEYVPLGEWLRGLIAFFDLPTSFINLGPDDQHGLKVDDLFISPSVCYEIAYPDLVATSAVNSQLLMSVSNLGWFGDSLGRHQFMEMAQMRALETQHYFIYSTNNGPSGVIDRQGKIQAETAAFTQTTLSAQVFASEGSTPFMKWGSLPLVLLCSAGLIAFFFMVRKKSSL